ncbi:MAG: Ig-like domain-containing protein [Gemmatimonadales bacterium]
MSRQRAILGVVLLLLACNHDSTGPGSGGPVPVASVLVSTANPTLMVGATRQLGVTVQDAGANPLPDRPVRWRSSSDTIASVSATGLVTGLRPGAVTITASSEGKSGSASLTIIPVPVASVTIVPSASSLGFGTASQLTALVADSAGHPLSGRLVTWSTGNALAVTVSPGGLATAVGVGTAVITATSEGKSGAATVTVDPIPVASVTVTPAAATVPVATTTTLTATTRDAAGHLLVGRVIAWSSSAPSIAQVDPSGVVTGVKPGTATVTATSEGRSASAAITIVPGAPASITISPSPASVVTGSTVQLAALVRDAAGDTLAGQIVTWSTNASAVATVNGTGLVTGVAPGTAILTAAVSGISAQDTVTVTPVPVASVSVVGSSALLGVGATAQFNAIPSDAQGRPLSDRVVEWSSSDSAIATVDGNGLVTGVSPGQATISATVEGHTGSAAITIDLEQVGTVIVVPGSLTVGAGLDAQLSVITLSASGDTLRGRTVSWSSSAPAVADVDAAGLVAGLGAGTAVITATSEGVSGSAQVSVVLNLAFPALDGGYSHTCSLTSSGEAYCWGLNAEGELGSGVFSPASAVPVLVTGGTRFASLYPGGQHTCALTQAGAAWCWGGNAGGQLGRGTTANSAVPAPVSGGPGFVSLTGGFSHTCGLTASGSAWCWGSNADGELGDGTTAARSTPVPVTGGLVFASLSARGSHTCGLTAAGVAYCWGRNLDGEVGDGTLISRSVPVAVAGGKIFAEITTGSSHTCARQASGAVYCWGDNAQSQIGDGTTTDRLTPAAVAGGFSFTSVKARGTHTCSLTAGGAAYCWGRNNSGQLGDGTTTDRSIPVPVQGGLSFTEINSGATFSCGITPSPLLYCWGDNSTGQLGNGSYVNSSVPVKVLGQP